MQGIYTIHIFDRFMILIKDTFIPLSEKTLNQFPRFYSRLVFTLVMISQVFITISCPVEAMQIPDLDTKGDVYKTEGLGTTDDGAKRARPEGEGATESMAQPATEAPEPKGPSSCGDTSQPKAKVAPRAIRKAPAKAARSSSQQSAAPAGMPFGNLTTPRKGHSARVGEAKSPGPKPEAMRGNIFCTGFKTGEGVF